MITALSTLSSAWRIDGCVSHATHPTTRFDVLICVHSVRTMRFGQKYTTTFDTDANRVILRGSLVFRLTTFGILYHGGELYTRGYTSEILSINIPSIYK
jgi:hypothetical protein